MSAMTILSNSSRSGGDVINSFLIANWETSPKTDVLSYISNVKYQGKILKYPNGQWITCNVKQALPYGDYKMEFVLAPRDFREQIGNLYLLKADAHSFVKLNPESQSKVASLRKENNQKRLEKGKDVYSDKEQELFEYWGVSNCNFIGLYHYDEKSGHSSIDDIRKPNFAKIPYYPNDEAKKPITLWLRNSIHGLNDGNYYLFNWKLSEADYNNPYEIYIDFKFKPQEIRPQWFIEQLFNDRYNDKSKNFESSTNFLDTLSKQLSAKESTFIYELLQNANDYPVDGVPVDVEFRILDNYLVFMHSGDYFNVRNISGICGINEKEKSANKKLLGIKESVSRQFFSITTTFIFAQESILLDLKRKQRQSNVLRLLGQSCQFGQVQTKFRKKYYL